MLGCSLVGDKRVLDGPYTDYDTYLNAELVSFPNVSARSIHFDGTVFVLSSEVNCGELPLNSVSELDLLEVPSGVNVVQWIRYRNADFGNEYSGIEAEKHELISGSVRLLDVRIEKEKYPLYDGQEVERETVFYRIEAENLVFEGDLKVPSVRTEEHSCFVGS